MLEPKKTQRKIRGKTVINAEKEEIKIKNNQHYVFKYMVYETKVAIIMVEKKFVNM